MTRPYIVCHMVTSLDGKVTGSYLSHPACEAATAVYYDVHRREAADGFICGRITMEGSFTGGWYPDLTDYAPLESKADFVAPVLTGRYAVAFDTVGKLGWKGDHIVDEDPGYDGTQIIEVLSEATDARYLRYLQQCGISYVFAGETMIDVALALEKLAALFGIRRLLLEGGSVLNGAFARAQVIDELSLVVAPFVADAADKPLFADSALTDFEPLSTMIIETVPVMRLKRSSR